MQKFKKNCPRAAAILLSLMMMVVFVPTFAFATGGDEGITVFMTISDKGELATANDGSAMAWKEVKVTDRDNDSNYSFDEALVAVHETYNTAEGYVSSGTSATGGAVSKLWGEESTNNLFFINGEGLPVGVKADNVADGDFLVASVNADQQFYADWFTMFDVPDKRATAGEAFTLNLEGHLGMAWTPEEKKNVPIEGVAVGFWDKGSFQPIEGAKTDAEGDVSLTIADPGVYIVSAKGTTKGAVTDYSLMKGSEFSMPPEDAYVKFDEEEYDSMFGVGYTENYIENPPYPIEQVHWVDWNEWYNNQSAYPNLLYSNQFSNVDCPIIAPACIVTVYPKADVTMTLNDKGVLAKAKDGSAMVEKPVTVKDINYDGMLSYDEALVAAHEAYCADGKAGYSAGMQSSTYGDYYSVTKLWSQDTSNAMFFANGKSTSSVDQAEVVDKDNLYTSINAEPSGRDYLTTFDKTTATVEQYSGLKVNLKGHVGAGYSEDELKDVNLSGIPVGVWKDGKFEKISGVVTDKEGNATVSFDKTGTYILTAKGEFDGTDWYGNPLKCPTMAPYCIVKVTPHVHKLTAVKAKLATAKKAGNTAYWKCAGCGKFFSDAKGTKEIKKNSWVVKKSTMTVKAKTVKGNSKKNTIIKKSKAFTVKKNPGKVTFKKLSGNKKITVSKAGKVTVKKGLKKGRTYTVKVKVTSAKTKKYAAISKTVKLKVKITK